GILPHEQILGECESALIDTRPNPDETLIGMHLRKAATSGGRAIAQRRVRRDLIQGAQILDHPELQGTDVGDLDARGCFARLRGRLEGPGEARQCQRAALEEVSSAHSPVSLSCSFGSGNRLFSIVPGERPPWPRSAAATA